MHKEEILLDMYLAVVSENERSNISHLYKSVVVMFYTTHNNDSIDNVCCDIDGTIITGTPPKVM